MRIGSAYVPSGNFPQLQRMVADAQAQGCVFVAIGGSHVEQDNGTDAQWQKYMDNRLDPAQVRQTVIGDAVVGKPVAGSADVPWAQNLVVERDVKPVPVRLLGRSPRGEALAYKVVTAPVHGRLTGTPPNLVYDPESGYNGEDVFIYRVNEGSGASSNHAYRLLEEPSSDASAR